MRKKLIIELIQQNRDGSYVIFNRDIDFIIEDDEATIPTETFNINYDIDTEEDSLTIYDINNGNSVVAVFKWSTVFGMYWE